MLKHIKTIGSLEEMLGSKMPREHIFSLVEQLPLMSYAIILSQLSTGSIEEKDLKQVFRQLYYGLARQALEDESMPKIMGRQVYQRILSNFDDVVGNSYLFPQQSILNLWKWLLSYGDEKKLQLRQENDGSIGALCYLSLATNDYLTHHDEESEENLYAELFSNAVFNNKENPFNTLARTMIIYTEIAKDKDLYHDKEFLDINKDFYAKNGYTIKEHIGIIFGLIASFLKPKELGARWLQDSDNLFANMKYSEQAKDVVKSLTTDFESISKWAKQELNSPWNFIEFRKTPLLRINESEFLPFSLNLLYEQLFTGLFHQVRHVYSETDRRFLTFYGKPFERYTQQLAKESITHTKLPYNLLPEFRYRKTKDSPDIMVSLNNKMLAIEVKSYRLTLPSITEANKEAIKKDMVKMIIKPLKQLHDRIKELKEINHDSVKGIEELYLMVVTQGDFPTIIPYEKEIEEELLKHFEIPIKAYYHLDIEEYEMFCQLLERKKPIFKMLDNKNTEQNKQLSFKTFLYDNSYYVKKNNILKEKFDTIINELGTMWFEDFVQKKQERMKKRNK